MHASSKTAASSSARGGAGSRTAASTPRAFVKTAAAALPSNKTAAEAQVRLNCDRLEERNEKNLLFENKGDKR